MAGVPDGADALSPADFTRSARFFPMPAQGRTAIWTAAFHISSPEMGCGARIPATTSSPCAFSGTCRQREATADYAVGPVDRFRADVGGAGKGSGLARSQLDLLIEIGEGETAADGLKVQDFFDPAGRF